MSPSEDAEIHEGCPRLGSTLKTFVINLARRPDRRSHIEEVCQTLELDYEIVDAVDGKALAALPGSSFEPLQKRRHGPLAKRRKEVEPLATDVSSPSQPSKGCPVRGMRGLKSQMYCAHWHDDAGKPQTQLLNMAQHRTQSSSLTQSGHELWGAVGCSLSHQAVLKSLIASPALRWALILEDDACFKQGREASKVREVFDEAMQLVAEWHPNWGVIYLGGAISTFARADSNTQLGQLQKGLRSAKGVYQTHAFMIRSDVAPEILELLKKGYAADAAYVCWSRKKSNELRTFLFQPQLLVQPRGTGRWKDSDIFVEGEFFKQEAAKLHDSEYRFNPKRKRAPPRIVIARADIPAPSLALTPTEDRVLEAPLLTALSKEDAYCTDFDVFVDDCFAPKDVVAVSQLDDKLSPKGDGKLSRRVTAEEVSILSASKDTVVEQPLDEPLAAAMQPTTINNKARQLLVPKAAAVAKMAARQFGNAKCGNKAQRCESQVAAEDSYAVAEPRLQGSSPESSMVCSVPKPVGLLASISARKEATISLLAGKTMDRHNLSENAIAAPPIGLLANISARKLVSTSLLTERSSGRGNFSENTKPARPFGLLANISARKAEIANLQTETSVGRENLPENVVPTRPVGLLAQISARKAGTAKILTDSLSENTMHPPIKKCRWSIGPLSEFPAKPNFTFATAIAKAAHPGRLSVSAELSVLQDITNTQGSGLGIC